MRDEGLLWVGTLNLERRRIAGSFVRLSGLTRMSLVYQLGSREREGRKQRGHDDKKCPDTSFQLRTDR